MNAPSRLRSTCAKCGKVIGDVSKDGVYQAVSGWVKNRSGGGAHGISLANREYRWACGECIEKEIKGTTNQNSML